MTEQGGFLTYLRKKNSSVLKTWLNMCTMIDKMSFNIFRPFVDYHVFSLTHRYILQQMLPFIRTLFKDRVIHLHLAISYIEKDS